MIYLVLILVLVALGLLVELVLLKRTMRDVYHQLWGISDNLDTNWVVKLSTPDKDMAELAMTINRLLDKIRLSQIMAVRHERDFQNQIENISHDLRTPLTVINGYLKMMDNPKKANQGEVAEALKIIEAKTVAMSKLTEQFYLLSQVSASDFALHLSRVDVVPVVREALAGQYEVLGSRLKIQAELPDVPIYVQADIDGLNRIVANLLQNAGRYANSYLRIEIRSDLDGVKLHFINDETGLTSTDIGHLFDRFYRQDKARSNGDSTGLGLTIARELARKMGGDLIARLKDNEICFELLLKQI